MPKFRKKPVVVEAIQFTEETWEEVSAMPNVTVYKGGPYHETPGKPLFAQLITINKETVTASLGDWIITEPNNVNHYLCKPDIFAATYEPV